MDKIITAIKAVNSILIFPHIGADGDAIGSSLAVFKLLENYNKQVDIVFEEEISFKYKFLFDNIPYFVFPDVPDKTYDMHMAIDTGDVGMLGKRSDLFNRCTKKVNIDHHQTNKEYADLNYVSEKAAAAGEIIYELIKSFGDFEINPFVATCLYVAVSTDTGGFRYGNTTKTTHKIAGELIEKNIDVEEISKKVFDIMPKPQINLIKSVLPGITLKHKEKIGVIKVRLIDYKRAGAGYEHSDGIINYARNIEGVQVAVALKEKEKNKVKVSFRSSGALDVSKVAKHFNGGGHRNAAGCTLQCDLEKAEKQVIQYLIGRMDN